MIKCIAIEEFRFSRFNEIQIIKRNNLNTENKIYKGDIFICDEEIAKYLTGNNDNKIIAVKIIEVIPKE